MYIYGKANRVQEHREFVLKVPPPIVPLCKVLEFPIQPILAIFVLDQSTTCVSSVLYITATRKRIYGCNGRKY